MFETIPMAPADPILGLTEAFKADPNPAKINLGVGVYKDETGQTPIFETVKKAEQRILESESSKSYLPISGAPEYADAVLRMLFGGSHEIVSSQRAATAQTPGGTGALRVAGDFLKFANPDATIYVSNPTWANHKGVFAASGLKIEEYPYYDSQSKSLDFEAMIAALGNIPANNIVLLHGCCHNPTGIDPTVEQWQQIAEVIKNKKLVALIDFAYQGLARGINEDADGMRIICEAGCETIITSSFSKNVGLYNERVGAITIVTENAEIATQAFSQVKRVIRANYSNPPSHGGKIVSTILGDAELRREWEIEVEQIRKRIQEMRVLFVETLKKKGVEQDFSFIIEQNGMFSFSGLNPDQVKALREKYAIYIVGSGRINVAGMTKANMEPLCEAIAEVLNG